MKDRERWRGSGASPRAGGRRSAVSGRARAAVDGAPIPAPRPAHRSVTGRLPDRERCPGRPPRPRGPLLRVDDLEHERAPRRVDLQTGFLAGFRLAHADRLSPSRGRPPGSTQSSRPPPVRCRSRTAPARTTTTEHRRSTSDSSLSWPGAGPPACIVIPDPHRREPPDGHRPGAPGPDHRRRMGSRPPSTVRRNPRRIRGNAFPRQPERIHRARRDGHHRCGAARLAARGCRPEIRVHDGLHRSSVNDVTEPR